MSERPRASENASGSYFSKSTGVNLKTLKLVSEIRRIDYTVSNSEFDALLLENNFIKQNQPKYNILLKDDKTFPYICILKGTFSANHLHKKIHCRIRESTSDLTAV